MRLRNMLKICLVFCESEPQYAYKRYAYKKKTCRSSPSKIKLGNLDQIYRTIESKKMLDRFLNFFIDLVIFVKNSPF